VEDIKAELGEGEAKDILYSRIAFGLMGGKEAVRDDAWKLKGAIQLVAPRLRSEEVRVLAENVISVLEALEADPDGVEVRLILLRGARKEEEE
jgi:hypothetical protein